MTEWNEALAAYDDECPDVEAVRAEFEAFLSASFVRAAARVAARFGEDWRGKVDSGAGPQTAWRARQDDVELSAWYPRAFDSHARGLAAGVSVYEPSAFTKPQAKRRRDLFLSAAASTLEGPPASDPDSDTLELDEETVRAATVILGAGADVALADALLMLAPLANALRQLHQRTTWLANAIGALATAPPAGVPAGVAWESPKLKTWAGGLYVGLHENDDRPAWICARPPGLLLLAHFGGEAVAQPLRARLAATALSIDDEPDVSVSIILDATSVAAAHNAKDVSAVQARALAALTAYYAG